MKKIIRIILSPLVFLVFFVGLTIIPIGPTTFLTGIFSWIINQLKDKPDWLDKELALMWFAYPWDCAKLFIKYGVI